MIGPWTATAREPHEASILDVLFVLLDSYQGLSLHQRAATLRLVIPLIRLDPQRLLEAALQKCKDANAEVCRHTFLLGKALCGLRMQETMSPLKVSRLR